jgi:hypothetical protein
MIENNNICHSQGESTLEVIASFARSGETFIFVTIHSRNSNLARIPNRPEAHPSRRFAAFPHNVFTNEVQQKR